MKIYNVMNPIYANSFYLYENLSLDVRNTLFSVYRDYEKESEKFNEIPEKEYIVMHDDPDRSLIIDKNRINHLLTIYFFHSFNFKSNSLKEISLFSVLIFILD